METTYLTRPLFCRTRLQPSTWVSLCQRPHPFSADEALLLCQEAEDYWLAWVPDCGEVRLHVNQFC